jgi:2-polyprenyl-3-methyl-5-hydroxy-6-metoxy-1,4-benzoquinol methylase
MPVYAVAHLCRCEACGFVFCQRIPAIEELKACYSTDNYERTCYFSPITEQRYNELLDSFAKYRKTNNLLDIGAGSGFLLEVAKRHGWNVRGTEFAEDAIEMCRKKGIHVDKGELAELGFEDNSFDVITGIEVIEHLNNPTEITKEIFRILRPGGVVYLTTPNFNSLLRKRLKSEYDVISYPLHLCYYTKGTLKKLFTDQGLQSLKISTTGISLTRFRTSTGKSNQQYVSETSDDEMLRYRIEKRWYMRWGKHSLNALLNLFKVGDSIKAGFIKPE